MHYAKFASILTCILKNSYIKLSSYDKLKYHQDNGYHNIIRDIIRIADVHKSHNRGISSSTRDIDNDDYQIPRNKTFINAKRREKYHCSKRLYLIYNIFFVAFHSWNCKRRNGRERILSLRYMYSEDFPSPLRTATKYILLPFREISG